MSEDKYLNTKQAAEYLQLSTKTIQRKRDQGLLKYYQDGKIIRYCKEDLDNYLTSFVMEPFSIKKGDLPLD